MKPNDFSDDIETIRQIPAIPSILEVICATTGMGFVAVARVTDDRWVACEVLDNVHFGLTAGSELKVETTLCREVYANRTEIVIENVADDDVYRDHHAPRLYGLQSYISVPIILNDGSLFGTLCAIDSKPATVKNPATIGMFRLFAEMIAYHYDASRQLNESRLELADARAQSELREQFIAVLGHDLRNPLASIESGAILLDRGDLGERERSIVKLMRSTTKRMGALVDNLMDFARGRLGGGIGLNLEPGETLRETLTHVIDESRAAWPDNAIEAALTIPGDLPIDHQRIAQLLSNLIGNAITHGEKNGPVRIEAGPLDGEFRLSVFNQGDRIPDAVMEQLFQPFARGKVRASQQGLGLGLYISSEIARAHGGRINVASDTEGTSFTFLMPLQQPAA